MSEDRYMTNTYEEVEAVVNDDAIWLQGALVPVLKDSEPGRRRMFHGSALMFFLVAVQIFGGHRKAARELRNPVYWSLFVDAFIKRYPSDVELRPSLDRPIQRHHYSWFKTCHSTATAVFGQRARQIARACAIRSARELGLCVKEGAGSATHPSALNVVAADGKVIRSRYLPRHLDKETGELIGGNRRDPTALRYMTGTGEKVLGNRFVIATTRGDVENQRIILDINIAPRRSGEAKHALDIFDELLPLLEAPEVVVYDGELRGTHLNHVMTRHGVIILARLNNKRGKQPLERHYGTVPVHDGSVPTLDLHLHDGAPYIKDLDEEGNVHLVPLTRAKLSKTQRSDRTWRWYMDLAVPESHGGGTIRLRCDKTAEDEETGLNRAEHLRLIPDNDPD